MFKDPVTGDNQDVHLINHAITTTDGIFSEPVDDAGTYVYFGKAVVGSDGASAVWMVTRITAATGASYVATGPGSSITTQIWDNRASLTYTEA